MGKMTKHIIYNNELIIPSRIIQIDSKSSFPLIN